MCNFFRPFTAMAQKGQEKLKSRYLVSKNYNKKCKGMCLEKKLKKKNLNKDLPTMSKNWNFSMACPCIFLGAIKASNFELSRFCGQKIQNN